MTDAPDYDVNLFGEPVVWNVAPPAEPPAADTHRGIYITCWDKCSFCDPTMLEQRNKNPKHRLYRVCTLPTRLTEERCFVDSVICERCQIFDDEHPKPMKGWEDF